MITTSNLIPPIDAHAISTSPRTSFIHHSPPPPFHRATNPSAAATDTTADTITDISSQLVSDEGVDVEAGDATSKHKGTSMDSMSAGEKRDGTRKLKEAPRKLSLRERLSLKKVSE